MYRLGQELLHAEKHGIPVHRVSIECRTLHAGELGLAIYLHPTGSAHAVPSTIDSRVSTSEEHRQIRSGAYQTLRAKIDQDAAATRQAQVLERPDNGSDEGL